MASLWNTLTGQKPHSQRQQQQQDQRRQNPLAPSPSPSPSPSSSPSSTTSSYAPAFAPFDPSTVQGVDSFLRSPDLPDPALLHPLAGLDKDTIEYVTLDESALSNLPGSQAALPSRGFQDDLCYGTGITYLTALSIGGTLGLHEGLKRSDGQPPKLRLNSVLNSVTRRGPFLANSAGVVAITYNCFNSAVGYLRGKHDAANTVAAGALSGMLFKSTKGVKPMLISGGIVASVATAWAIVRHVFFPQLASREAPSSL